MRILLVTSQSRPVTDFSALVNWSNFAYFSENKGKIKELNVVTILTRKMAPRTSSATNLNILRFVFPDLQPFYCLVFYFCTPFRFNFPQFPYTTSNSKS